MKKFLLFLPVSLLICGGASAFAVFQQSHDFSALAAASAVSHPAYFFGSSEPLPVFSPNAPLTRSDAVQMLRVLLSDPSAIPFPFDSGTDPQALEQTHWMLQENESTSFQPDEPLSRAEFAQYLAAVFPLRTDTEPFRDVPETHPAFAAVLSAKAYGWVQGDQNLLFRPDDPITRVEAVVMLNRAAGRVPDPAYIDSARPAYYRDVTPANWYYYEVMEAAVPHEAQLSGKNEQWTAHTSPTQPPEDGFYWIDGQLYCYSSEKADILRNESYGRFSFSASGQFSADSSRLDRKAKAFVQENGRVLLSDMEAFLEDASRLEEWNLILINGDHPLPDGFSVPELTALDNGYLIDSRVYPALQSMLAAARNAGYSPLVCSAYRTWEKQASLHQQRVNRFLQQGYSREKAESAAAFWVARPGTSEHQAGLAVDIVDSAYPLLNKSQEKRPVQQWLMEHCAEYGFILRYPTDRSDRTGVGYEPWHYRYVGVEAASEIMAQGICLEEYLGE